MVDDELGDAFLKEFSIDRQIYIQRERERERERGGGGRKCFI